MPVTYVVDGYNLLFHLGLRDRRAGAQALELARRRLLEQVRATLGEGDHQITVVFDSGRTRRKMPAPTVYLGIDVRYSGGGDFADDVIEAIIAECRRPQSLVVVSNDHRIQQAAQRKGAQAWSCEELLDHGESRGKATRAPAEEPERTVLSREEMRHWLEEFGGLADDPDFREVFDPFPFKDEA
jgi:predicted RNA-binding protein with PIN domain